MKSKTWEFTKIPRQLIQLMPSLHWASVKLYFYLQARTNEERGDHKSWPAYRTIQTEAGLTNEYISRAIKQLEEFHLLEKLRGRHNIYTLKVPNEEQMTELLKRQVENGKGFLSFGDKSGPPHYGEIKKLSSLRSREANNGNEDSEEEMTSLSRREHFSKEQRAHLYRVENKSLKSREKLDESKYMNEPDEVNLLGTSEEVLSDADIPKTGISPSSEASFRGKATENQKQEQGDIHKKGNPFSEEVLNSSNSQPVSEERTSGNRELSDKEIQDRKMAEVYRAMAEKMAASRKRIEES